MMGTGPKGSELVGASLMKKEDAMKLITRAELAKLSLVELKGLYRKMFNVLAASGPDSPQRRNALESLENIRREIALRPN